MLIQKINNSPAFGYNKKLNTQLVNRLEQESEQDKYTTPLIKGLNSVCNNTEELLNLCDEEDEDKADDLLTILTTNKLTLADMVNREYPDLNYIEREAESYEKEAQYVRRITDDPYPWQFQMSWELIQLLPVTNNKNSKDDNIPEDSLKTDENKNIPIFPKPPAQRKDTDCNIVERFVPNEFSPKGFESIGGMEKLKEQLIDDIIYPAQHPEEAALDLAEYGKRSPRGFLLYGPPGCGKTSTTEALSQESGMPLFKLKISRAGSPYINETSNNYQRAFNYVSDYAKTNKTPCLILIDEIDGLTKGRGRNDSTEDLKQIGTLLNLVETARENNIIVIAATNKYDLVDEAVKRRFDRQIYLGMPDTDCREQILQKTLEQWRKGADLAQNKDDLREIAQKTAGFPSSALVILADKASDIARKDGRRPIRKEDFLSEIENNQNLKIEEKNYMSAKTMRPIGFSG